MIIKTDLEFNRITEIEIFNNISEAFNSLAHETRMTPNKEEIVQSKASQMKEKINSYIDWQVSRLI